MEREWSSGLGDCALTATFADFDVDANACDCRHREDCGEGRARSAWMNGIALGIAVAFYVALLGLPGLPVQVALADDGLVAGVTMLTTAPLDSDDGAALAERMGMTLDVVDPVMVEEKQLSPDCGLYVSAVEKGGPAAAAGIRVGDVLTHVDGAFIVSMDDLDYVLEGKAAGDSVMLRLERGKEILLVQVVFDDGTAEDLNERGYSVRDWRSAPANGGIYGSGAGLGGGAALWSNVDIPEDLGGGAVDGAGDAGAAEGDEAVAGAGEADGSRVAVADSGGPARDGAAGSADSDDDVDDFGTDVTAEEIGYLVPVIVGIAVVVVVAAVAGAVALRRRRG